MAFTISIKGQVDQLDLILSKSLWPLFETIINAIQSLEDTDEQHKQITIEARRNNVVQQEINANGNLEDAEEQFYNFVIIDNGNGFTEKNYKSFLEAYSRLKVKKGCKGIGRFLWLKAFESVSVFSRYVEEGKWFERKFDFSVNGIVPENNITELIGTDFKRETRIELKEFKSKYRNTISNKLEDLAKKIIEHCLPYFLMGSLPEIILKDENGKSIQLSTYYQESYQNSIDKAEMSLNGKEYVLYHMVLPNGTDKHELHLCANNREVKSVNLGKKIPNMQKRLEIGGINGFYVGYLSGEYLDESVNATRSGFNFQDMPLITGQESSDEEQIIDKTVEFIKSHYKEELDKVDTEKRKIIDHFVQSRCPKYRYLLNSNPDVYDNIPYGLPNEKLELELFQQEQKWEYKIAEQKSAIEEHIKNNVMSEPAFEELFSQYCKGITDLSRAGLAEYVARRKAVIDLLEKALESDYDGKYSKESKIHSIICPMRVTSDEIPFDSMNLWLIDDRLAYHRYLASDKKMKSIPFDISDEDKRMDIAVFDAALSYTADDDNINSITIVELKRPMRDDLATEDTDPITQVYNYVTEIKENRVKKSNGRSFGNVQNAAFYCYIIADITDSLKRRAKIANLIPMQDGEGYFGYNQPVGTYIEIISYDKLLKNAKQRNQVLFDKLFTTNANQLS